MFRHALRMCAVLAVAAVVAAPAAAYAEAPTHPAIGLHKIARSDLGSLVRPRAHAKTAASAVGYRPYGCQGWYLADPFYGGIEYCTDVVGGAGGTGTPGFSSELTGDWNPTSTTLRVSTDPELLDGNGNPAFIGGYIQATDGPLGCFIGYAALDSAYGPVIFGTHVGADGRG